MGHQIEQHEEVVMIAEKRELDVRYSDGSNPSRSEYPLERGWHLWTRVWRQAEGGWSPWGPDRTTYASRASALAASRRSQAARVLGRDSAARAGRAGRGAAKRRGGDTPQAVSAHMRDVRAKRQTISVREALRRAAEAAGGRASVEIHYGANRRADRAVRITGCFLADSEAIGLDIERALGLAPRAGLRLDGGLALVWF